MKSIKYLILLSIVLIILASIVRIVLKNVYNISNKQVQPISLVSPDSKSPYLDGYAIPKDIIIDDHEKPVVIAKKKNELKPKPYITAESYLVANLETGLVYIEHNPNKVFPIASVSKLYTALVVHHLFNLNSPITITQAVLDEYGDAGGLMLGEKFLPEELLHILLMVSSNDAAMAFAESFAKEGELSLFMEQMNAFASEIGMNNTYFEDPSGLNSKNTSNASDLLALSRYLYKSENEILNISKKNQFDIATTTEHGSHHLVNINPLTIDQSFIGGKTGRTSEAKEAMISMFNRKIGEVTYPIAIIVLRSDMGERELNTLKLLKMFEEKMGN